jgi:hypothetical protein
MQIPSQARKNQMKSIKWRKINFPFFSAIGNGIIPNLRRKFNFLSATFFQKRKLQILRKIFSATLLPPTALSIGRDFPIVKLFF